MNINYFLCSRSYNLILFPITLIPGAPANASNSNNPNGTLPRPQATVKPLPAADYSKNSYPPPLPQKPAAHDISLKKSSNNEIIAAVDVHHGGGGGAADSFQLPEVKKPDFSLVDDEGIFLC